MKLKTRVLALLFAGVTALTGCRFSAPITEYREGRFHAGISYRGGTQIQYHDVENLEDKEIPVHPDDSGFLSGSTTVNAEEGDEWTALPDIHAGLEGIVGFDPVSFFAGIDGILNTSRYDNSEDFLYDFRQQESDTRPKSSGSFVYDKIRPELFGYMPFFGAEINLNNFSVGAEIGFPYKKWEREWGHHRYDEEEEIGDESDSDIGLRKSLSLKFKDLETGYFVGVTYSISDYNLDFADIESQAITIDVTKRF